MSFEGSEETIRAIKGLGEIAGREVQLAALKKVAQPIADELGRRCPKDTGLTAEDFGVAESRDSKDGGEIAVFIGAHGGKRGRAYIANFIERGVPAHGIAARPFIRPTIDEAKSEIPGRYVEELRPAYRRIVNKYTR